MATNDQASSEQPEALELYDVETQSGTPTTLKLTKAEAERLGLTGSSDALKADESGEQAASQFKARGVTDDAPRNKARSADTK